MTKIILVRHGESELNKEKVFFGWLDPILTENGENSINSLSKKIPDYDFIYSSPLKRALSSAEILNHKKIEILVEERIKELNFGIFEGMNYNEIKNTYPEESEKWDIDGIHYLYKQGESITHLNNRVLSFIEEIKNTDKNYLIVTHFGVINSVLSHYISENISSFWKFKSDLATITIIEFHEGFPVLKMFSYN